jgi:SPOR domain
MADDNTLRSYRSNDPYRRSANRAEAQDAGPGAGDPLAELARLIGQPDPFHDNIRRQPQSPTHHADDTGDWRRHVQRPSYDEPTYDDGSRYAPPESHDDPYRMTAHHDDVRAQHADPYADPYRMTERHDDRYHDDRYDEPHADRRHDLSYAAADYPEHQMYADEQRHAGYGEELHHRATKPNFEEDYDDPPRRRRSGSGLLTAVVLIGCAMLGTAGAYGYRTYSTSGGSGQAPIIIADSAPSKIVPNAEQKSARSQDRIGQGDERLVSREEQPVSLPTPGTPAVPRVVFPSPIQQAPTTTGTTPPSASSAVSSSMEQPKRVRTVTIRPDGGDASGRPGDEASSRTAQPPVRTAAPPPTRPARDVPLSLDPTAPAQEPVRPQQRPAPREAAQPAPRVASAPSNGNIAGGYLVQVSSQRSEADAQSSYRGLQSKYSQLKSRQAIIKRADLGSKGVYYRAMVGPFESSDEAGQFCSGLKQAGGQCIILRN